jgi:hypothetical protein
MGRMRADTVRVNEPVSATAFERQKFARIIAGRATHLLIH